MITAAGGGCWGVNLLLQWRSSGNFGSFLEAFIIGLLWFIAEERDYFSFIYL